MADGKLTAENANTTPAVTDLLYMVDDPAGSPDTQKITFQNFLKVINGLTEDTSPALSTDFVLTYDISASDVKKVKPSNLISSVGETANGWVSPSATWTYASATTITVPTGAASIYSIGDKIKLTANSVVLYAYIVSVADTILTVKGNSLTNHAFTNNYYSKKTSPVNFPTWFAYTPTKAVSGGTVPTYTAFDSSRFCMDGRKVTVVISWNNTAGGTAGAGGNPLTFTLPVTGVFADTGYTGRDNLGAGLVYESGGTISFIFVSPASATTAQFVKVDTVTITGADQSSTSRFISSTFSYEC